MPTYVLQGGELISSAISNMIILASETQEKVTSTINRVRVEVNPGDSAQQITDYYEAELERRHQRYLNSPKGQRALRRQQREAERDAKAAQEPISTFSVKDEDAWQRVLTECTGPSLLIARYAARWASFMEKRITQGASLRDIAQETSDKADFEGMSGASFLEALALLAHHWVHGDLLIRWHNAKYLDRVPAELASAQGLILNPTVIALPPEQ